MTLVDRAEQLLAWWQLGYVSSERVIAWADALIAAASKGTDVPGWLIELSLRGPIDFVDHPEPDYPRPTPLTYVQQFRAMIENCDPDDEASVRRFAIWCARAAMGEDLSLSEVRVGYEIEHAYSYQNSGNPIEIARNTVARFLPQCHDIASFFEREEPANDKTLSGMDPLPEYSLVEVVELLHAPEYYDGWKVNKRPPAIGDRGYVVDRLGDDDYIVECSGPDGVDIWLGDFKRRELRSVADAG